MKNLLFLVLVFFFNSVLAQDIIMNRSSVFAGKAEPDETGESISVGKFTTENQSYFEHIRNFERSRPISAGAIDPFNPTHLYYIRIDYSTLEYSLRILNLDSNEITILGILITDEWTGLEFDPTDGRLYGVSLNSLYEIDSINITSNLIGGTGLNVHALAINGNGIFYTYDSIDNNFYSLDKNNAQATLIGPLNFDPIGGAGMAWDSNTDKVYMVSLNSNFEQDFREVDLNSGNTTLIGNLDPGSGIFTKNYQWISFNGSALSNREWRKNIISLYPNPAKDYINIRGSNIVNALTIFDTYGKLITEIRDTYSNPINISKLKSGLYFFQIETEEGMETFKIIKE